MRRGPDCNRPRRVCALASRPWPAVDSDGHQNAFSRHGGIYRSDVAPKNQPRGGNRSASRRSAPSPGKRTRREEHALLIVRDEFRSAIPRSGCSPAEPVSASPTRPAYSDCRPRTNRLSSNGSQCLNWLSHLRGQAHLHLSAKRGDDPFEIWDISRSHPPDDARMRLMLVCLDLCGFDNAAGRLRQCWSQFLAEAGLRPEPEYQRCVPDTLLGQIAGEAKAGVEGIGCRLASPETDDEIHELLNSAWDRFWTAPESYVEWERRAMQALWPPNLQKRQ